MLHSQVHIDDHLIPDMRCTALAFAYVDSILHSEDPVFSAVSAVSFLEGKTYPLLELAGFQRMVFEDFSEELVSVIRAIAEPQPGKFIDDESLLEAFQTPECTHTKSIFDIFRYRLMMNPKSSFKLGRRLYAPASISTNPHRS
jgi:hypothetical protein